ncbi:MAG: hypothetical protein QM656_10365 [Paracoccaceae bacterium]
MALQMARPQKNKKSGVYYFRQRVPTDLRRILGDKIVSRSLRTKDPETAKLRNVEEVRKQAVICPDSAKASAAANLSATIARAMAKRASVGCRVADQIDCP